MDVPATLLELDQLTDRLRASAAIEVDEAWRRLQEVLDALDAEAAVLALPTAKVREEIRRIRQHLGAVLGKDETDGHSRSQHLVWALGAIDGLRSDHCFGPVLAAHGPAEG